MSRKVKDPSRFIITRSFALTNVIMFVLWLFGYAETWMIFAPGVLFVLTLLLIYILLMGAYIVAWLLVFVLAQYWGWLERYEENTDENIF